MPYGRVDDILRLALRMQATAEGVSIDDIAGEFGVARRTAERMRDAVLRAFPQADDELDGRVKRWRIPSGTLNGLVGFSAEELARISHTTCHDSGGESV